MAIWTGATYNNTLIASATSQLHRSGQIIEQIRKRYPLLNVLMGEAMPDGTRLGGLQFRRVKYTGGKEIKIRLLGSDLQPSVLSRGSNELSASTPAAFNGIAAATVRTTPYQRKQYISGSEIEEIRGKESETESLLQDYVKAWTVGFMEKLSTDICSTNLPSATAVGGIQAMVSDGLTAAQRDAYVDAAESNESAYAQYLVDRSDSDNAFARSGYYLAGSTLDLDDLSTIQVNHEAAGGVAKICAMGPTAYSTIKRSVEALTAVTYDEEMTKLGARFVIYSGMTLVPEQRLPANRAFLLDPDTFTLYLNEIGNGFNPGGLVEDSSRENAYFMKFRAYVQFVCDRPASNAKVIIA